MDFSELQLNKGGIRPASNTAKETRFVGKWVLAAIIIGSRMAFIDGTARINL